MSLILAVIFLQVPSHEIKEVWKPYSFKGTEYFNYEIISIQDGKKEKGFYTIDISKEGDKYKIKIEGKLGENEGTFTTTVSKPEEITQSIVAQMMFNPYLAPLGITLFTSAWTFVFSMYGFNLEVGSKWKTKENDKITEVEIPGYETYAGIKGKKLVIKENGKEVYTVVWNEKVALPLYIKTSQEGETYELKLIKYKD